MSIRPVNFNPDGSVDVVFDETGHSGTISADQIKWTQNMDGSENHSFIVLECPDGCGSTSTHPVGGGAAPANVQRMFVDKTSRDGCACDHVSDTDTDTVCEAHVKLNVNRMDGMGRWQLDNPPVVQAVLAEAESILSRAESPEATPLENAPNMFQVIYRDADRVIVGLEPAGGGVGPDNKLAVIHDMAEYDNLMRYDPAYLSEDKAHILAAPEA